MVWVSWGKEKYRYRRDRMMDIEQFKADFLPLQPAMQRMAEHLLGCEEDAADVVQDCFVYLWNERSKLEEVRNKEAWCIALVKRKSIDMLRKRKVTEPIEDQYDLHEEMEEENERLDVAFGLIAKLPERQAKAVRLRHFDALETNEIAKEMDVSEGNVYLLLSRAYKKMRQMLNQL